MNSSTSLQPVHHSIPAGGIKPVNMSSAKCSTEELQTLERIALSIFTDCSNAGLSLQKTLAAILASGMNLSMDLEEHNL